MDTKNTRTKTMPKMQIAILEQTKKETKMTKPTQETKQQKKQNNIQHTNIKLLSPKADVLTKLDYGRVSARLQI